MSLRCARRAPFAPRPPLVEHDRLRLEAHSAPGPEQPVEEADVLARGAARAGAEAFVIAPTHRGDSMRAARFAPMPTSLRSAGETKLRRVRSTREAIAYSPGRHPAGGTRLVRRRGIPAPRARSIFAMRSADGTRHRRGYRHGRASHRRNGEVPCGRRPRGWAQVVKGDGVSPSKGVPPRRSTSPTPHTHTAVMPFDARPIEEIRPRQDLEVAR